MPLVDRDVIIDALCSVPQAIARLDAEEQAGLLLLSPISYLKVLVGCKSKREQGVTEKFLQRFTLVLVDPNVCKQAIDLVRQYHLSHGLLLADAFIAATALVHAVPFRPRASFSPLPSSFLRGAQAHHTPTG